MTPHKRSYTEVVDLTSDESHAKVTIDLTGPNQQRQQAFVDLAIGNDEQPQRINDSSSNRGARTNLYHYVTPAWECLWCIESTEVGILRCMGCGKTKGTAPPKERVPFHGMVIDFLVNSYLLTC